MVGHAVGVVKVVGAVIGGAHEVDDVVTVKLPVDILKADQAQRIGKREVRVVLNEGGDQRPVPEILGLGQR